MPSTRARASAAALYVGVAASGAALFPSPATAQLAPGSYRLGKSVVNWPVDDGAVVAAGSLLTLRVRTATGAPHVTVSLIRQDGLGVIRRQALRNGDFTFRVSQFVGKKYKLEARAGHLRTARFFTIGAPRDATARG